MNCPSCGSGIAGGDSKCPFCGNALTPSVPIQGSPIQGSPIINAYAQKQPDHTYVGTKSKTTAGVLAILLGGIGIHKFYLGNIGWGILYIFFCWTGIPSVVGLIEGIVYLTASDEGFDYKYNRFP